MKGVRFRDTPNIGSARKFSTPEGEYPIPEPLNIPVASADNATSLGTTRRLISVPDDH